MMQFRTEVHSAIRQPEIEHNYDHTYVRYNYQHQNIHDEDKNKDYEDWIYSEIYMTNNEYNDVQVGKWNGEWNEGLRSIERA